MDPACDNTTEDALTVLPQAQALPSAPSSSVVIRGLRKTPVVEADAIQRIFSVYGAVSGVTVLTTKHMAGTAFVDFVDDTSVDAALGAAKDMTGLENFRDPSADAVTIERKRLKPPPPVAPAAALRANASVVLTKRESDSSGAVEDSQKKKDHAASSSSTTLYVRGEELRAIFDVFDFFRGQGVEGRLKNCVFVTSSRKPYFLLDCEGNRAFFLQAIEKNGALYKGKAVTVSISAQSCAEYLAKKPDAVQSKKKETRASRGDGEAPANDDEGAGQSKRPQPTPAIDDVRALLAFKPRVLLQK